MEVKTARAVVATKESFMMARKDCSGSGQVANCVPTFGQLFGLKSFGSKIEKLSCVKVIGISMYDWQSEITIKIWLL